MTRQGKRLPKTAGRSISRRNNDSEKLAPGGLARHVGYFARRLQIWVFKDFNRKLAGLKVKPAQYSVLLIIEANPGCSQSAIAQTLAIERAGLARLLHRLEARGWVVRGRNDGRSYSLRLTAAGRTSLERIKAAAMKHEANLAARLGRARWAALRTLLRDFG